MNLAQADIRRLLADSPNLLIPELAATSTRDLVKREPGRSLLNWAREASNEIPLTTYTLYRKFRETGERSPYEGPYFEKRRLLTQAVVAAWLGNDTPEPTRAPQERINDLIWSICEESTWVLPAHEREPWHIDLFAAETGVELAHVLFVLGECIPEEIHARVKGEITDRILDPYLQHAHEFPWREGRNNWTGVCAGSIGQAFLLLEPDLDRQAQAVALVLEQLERFIDRAFEEDGVCLEGIGYWNYGLLHYVAFAEMLRARTGDAIDLLSQDKMRQIAAYPLHTALAKHAFASFADSAEASDVRPYLAARLSKRTGAKDLLDLMGGATDWRFAVVLRNMLWWDGVPGGEPKISDTLLPISGIARLVSKASGRTLVVAVKAGHNNEPHNHNDVGSFVLRIGNVTYLCDPGGGLYSADYFSRKRYENVFANSYGHSVPRIGGALQETGEARRGRLKKGPGKSVEVEFHQAYNIPTLEHAQRTVAIHRDGSVELRDEFQFKSEGLPVEEALVTWQEVDVDGSTARILSEEGVLEVRTDHGTFSVERLEEASKANRKPHILKRITCALPAAQRMTCRFTMTYRARQQ